MARENVLELQIVRMNDKYSAVTITMQDDNVIKRGKFNFTASNNVDIVSLLRPAFYLKCLYIRGDNELEDNSVLIIKNENIPLIEKAVQELNQKHGSLKHWRADEYGIYYYISEVSLDAIKTVDDNLKIDVMRYGYGNYFRTKEQAEECAKRIKKVIEEYHQEIGE